MRQAHVPQCPDCTYRLTGLTTPRCPECGLQFDARLLTDPDLARPRPAWERRPHVGLIHAAWRTVIDVTFHPRTFFAGIQQPHRLRRALTWPVCTAAISFLVVVTYILAVNRFTGRCPSTFQMTWLPYFREIVTGVGAHLLAGLALIALPLTVMLLIADLVFWHDRDRFRLLFKGTCYSTSIYAWLAVGICGVGCLLTVRGPRGAFWHDRTWLWTNWMTATAITWQYVLLYYGLLARRFAALCRPRPQGNGMSLLLVISAWSLAIYLTLFDNHLGLRFTTEAWTWEIVR